jgi:hypothetical protein
MTFKNVKDIIITKLKAGEKPRDIAEALKVSIPLVYRYRNEIQHKKPKVVLQTENIPVQRYKQDVLPQSDISLVKGLQDEVSMLRKICADYARQIDTLREEIIKLNQTQQKL